MAPYYYENNVNTITRLRFQKMTCKIRNLKIGKYKTIESNHSIMHLQPPPFPPILLRHWLKIRSMKRKQLNPKLLTCHTPHIHPRKIFKNSA